MRTAAIRFLIAGAVALLVVSHAVSADSGTRVVGAAGASFEEFLDRLMRAESGGNDLAANPRSSALGPFQFIKSTFLDLARRHFRAEVETLADEDVLALRTDRQFARRAAALHSMENMVSLIEHGLDPTFGNLRLAYLVGATGAARLLRAVPDKPAAEILGGLVIRANPFIATLTASDLIARAARDVSQPAALIATAPHARVRTAAVRPAPIIAPRPGSEPPAGITVRCNQKLVACRRWIAMQANMQRVAQLAAARKTDRRGRAPARMPSRPGV